MVAGHSSTLRPLLSSCGLPLNFIIVFRVMLTAVAFVTATAPSNPAQRGVYPERKPQENKSSCTSSPQAPSMGRGTCQVSDSYPSALGHVRRYRPDQPTHQRAPHSHLWHRKRGSWSLGAPPSQLSFPLGRCEAPRLFSPVPGWQIGCC